MSAPWARLRLPALAIAVAAAPLSVVDAADLTFNIPPYPPKTVTYSQCASFTFNGSTLTCVTQSAPPPPPPSDPEQPPTTPGTPFAGCPQNALMIDAPWGNNAINTFDYGYFGPNILSVRFTVPVNAAGGTKSTSWVEYGTAPFVREAVLSTAACDFSNTNALRNAFGQVARSSPNTTRFSFQYTTGPAAQFSIHLDPGKTYYLNVRNQFSDGALSCPIPSCAMRGGFPQ